MMSGAIGMHRATSPGVPNQAARVAERRVIILGSTGSIGTQTLDVIGHLNMLSEKAREGTRYRVVGLAAGTNWQALSQQARELGVTDVALADASGAADGADGMNLRAGNDAGERLVREVECDVVLAATVGVAGLGATLAAVQLGRDVALANKETLVAGGGLVVPAARESGSRLLPVDSEHAGVWQCLPGCAVPPTEVDASVSKVILTASGGPFRERSREDVYNASVEEALNHPTWDMGAKVTVDSASLMNKGLEVLEAHWLFGLGPERIGVLVHPQSIVHALVEYADGGVLAQLGQADMRGPIQHALEHPARREGRGRRIDWSTLRSLEFAEPDPDRFPALGLAWEVMRRDARAGGRGLSGAVLNAANESAVGAFLDGRVAFGRIAELCAQALETIDAGAIRGLDDVHEADREARRFVAAKLGDDTRRTRAGGGP